MKIFINNPQESWVVDRFRKEWYESYSEISTEDIFSADIVWIIAPWQWAQLPEQTLKEKKVVCTIHHLVPNKFDYHKLREFLYRDQFVDLYHVPSEKTRDQIQRLTSKPVFTNPFWVNQNLWVNIPEKEDIRREFNIDKDCYLIGSFQRDTEGSDLKSPKLEKGPDQFCDAVEEISKTKNVEVLLAGWRRQYVINRLKAAGVRYHYFELPDFNVLNKLYNCLDLYVVASRYEGGPQAIFECATTKTPILSTDVGAAALILDSESIFKPGEILKAKPNLQKAYDNVEKLHIPHGFDNFLNAFGGLK